MKGYLTMSTKELARVSVLERLLNGEIKGKGAACELGLSLRQIRRLKGRYRHQGAEGLIHRNRGRPSSRKIPQTKIDEALNIIKQQYYDFGPTLAQEKLVTRHGISLSVETLRKVMAEAGLWKAKKQRVPKVYQQRPRRACEGELIQVDGSPFAWFEKRGPECTLLVFIDDATGKLEHLMFAQSESTQAYFEAAKHYLLVHGKPLAFYCDKHGVFRVNTRRGGTSDTKDSNGLTQFGRAMAELRIEPIFADTPQAKGRVEKVNRTLQDRLVKELRLMGKNTLAEGNDYLPEFTQDFNRRFAVEPKSQEDVHRPLLPTENLDQILIKKYTRILSKNLELQYKNVLYQIQTNRPTYALRNAPVIVTEDYLGKVKIYYKNQRLTYRIRKRQPKSEIVDSKRLNSKVFEIKKQLGKEGVRWTPPLNHPWRGRTFSFCRP